MSSQIAPTPAELTLTILSGPDQGAIYKLVNSRITIGRATDNSVVLKDPRCSRHHVEIEIKTDGIYARDVSTQNHIEVDGQITKEAILKSGSHISIGETIMQFNIKKAFVALPDPVNHSIQTSSLTPSGPQPYSNTLKKTNINMPPIPNLGDIATGFRNTTPNQKKFAFYAVALAVVLGLIWLLSSNDHGAKQAQDIRTDSQIDEELKLAQERRDALVKKQMEKGVGTAEYNEIQALYLQGFRDYREGNFSRAIQSFEAVLALNPKHDLANKYRELSKRRLDEAIEANMRDGRRYMEQGKYPSAMSSFRQVMTLLQPDVQNRRYKEAYALYLEAELLMRSAY